MINIFLLMTWKVIIKSELSKPILVITGASGFIGSVTSAIAVKEGFRVWAVSRSEFEPPDGAEMIRVSDYAEIKAPLGATLIHLAEPAEIFSVESNREAHLSLVSSTVSSLLRQRWSHVIYGSSVAVYGDTEMYPRRPDEVVSPKDLYSIGKLLCEKLVLDSGGTVIRLSNIFGSSASRPNIFMDLIRQLNKNGPVYVRNSAPERDFLWVDDVARGFLMVAMQPSSGIYNMASGRTVSIAHLARVLLHEAGQLERPIYSISKPIWSRIALDLSDTISTFGWKPTMQLESGLRRLVGGNT